VVVVVDSATLAALRAPVTVQEPARR
jgi:hypothetical protein